MFRHRAPAEAKLSEISPVERSSGVISPIQEFLNQDDRSLLEQFLTVPNAVSAASFAAVWDGANKMGTLEGLSKMASGRFGDLVDGFLARALNQSSQFGAGLDAALDKIGVAKIIHEAWKREAAPRDQLAAGAKVDPQDKAILQKQVNINTTTYRNGAEYDAVKEMIVPGFFLVLFYMLITFLGNQMLNSTVEEKENRTVEMLLTTVQARTLILGKIIAMVVLAIIQGLVVAAPVLILYLTLGQNLHMPSFDLTGLIFDPVRICVAISVFVTGFMTFTGLLVAIGAIMPTAKEAANWFGIVLIAMFGPLYGATAFVSYPESPFVQFLSYFPLTSPIPLLLRNAVGNLQPHEAIIAISILTVSAVVSVLVAVRLFRYGAMQYDSKLSLSVLRARRT